MNIDSYDLDSLRNLVRKVLKENKSDLILILLAINV